MKRGTKGNKVAHYAEISRALRRASRNAELPESVQKRTRKSYRLWKGNPRHPSLHFKKVHPTDPVYSARVGLDYRAVGLKREDGMVWFWIGPHDEYERLLARL